METAAYAIGYVNFIMFALSGIMLLGARQKNAEARLLLDRTKQIALRISLARRRGR